MSIKRLKELAAAAQEYREVYIPLMYDEKAREYVLSSASLGCEIRGALPNLLALVAVVEKHSGMGRLPNDVEEALAALEGI